MKATPTTTASPKPPAPETATAFRVATAEFIAGAIDASKLPAPALAEVAFAGRSNVGKSSLLNTMMQRKSLVRTSRTPGCTRQINVFDVAFSSKNPEDVWRLHLVDLPGYGYAKRSKQEKGTWGEMLEGYLRNRATLRAVIVLVDVRRGLEEDDQQLLEFITQPREAGAVEAIVVATKIDKLPLAQRLPALAKVQAAAKKAIGFSSVSGDGREILWRRIRATM
jgi:GTP-binding protein